MMVVVKGGAVWLYSGTPGSCGDGFVLCLDCGSVYRINTCGKMSQIELYIHIVPRSTWYTGHI